MWIQEQPGISVNLMRDGISGSIKDHKIVHLCNLPGVNLTQKNRPLVLPLCYVL